MTKKSVLPTLTRSPESVRLFQALTLTERASNTYRLADLSQHRWATRVRQQLYAQSNKTRKEVTQPGGGPLRNLITAQRGAAHHLVADHFSPCRACVHDTS